MAVKPRRFMPDFMCRVAVGRLTMSQVDPAVFAELPPEVAAELAAALPPSHASFFTEGNVMPAPSSPSASGEDAVAAAQAVQRAQTVAKVRLSTLFLSMMINCSFTRIWIASMQLL